MIMWQYIVTDVTQRLTGTSERGLIEEYCMCKLVSVYASRIILELGNPLCTREMHVGWVAS
jgi:hypothetical protein